MAPQNHPVRLNTQKIAWQKLDYIHNNPVKAGFVREGIDWQNSSTVDYNNGRGLLDVLLLDPIII